MGLLDDAIREHLDLKRARGADPAEIEWMEREALGPVRREPTLGSPRLDVIEDHAPHGFEPEYDDEPLTELEELQELGYHDSTAPHPHAHHEHAHPHHEHAPDEAFFEPSYLEDLEPPVEQVEQPKRRFLRRNRPAAPSETAAPDPGFHEEAPLADPYDEQHDVPVDEPPVNVRRVDAPPTQEPGSARPPHLQFENPPKRPRFSAEPPSLADDDRDEPELYIADEAPAEPESPLSSAAAPPAEALLPSVAPEPEPVEPEPPLEREPPVERERLEREPVEEPPAEEPDVQETTEFDVQKHLAETQHTPEDEDVLEETPEFLQDTPEHDRLWFEQRPPRDFDFDG